MQVEQIGDCTLYCGDAEAVLPLLSGIGQILTSPPFNAGHSYESTTWPTLEDLYAFTSTWVRQAAHTLRNGGWMFVEVQDMHLSPEHPHALPGQTEQESMQTHAVIMQAMRDAGLLFKETVVWDRGRWGGNASRLICAPGSPAILGAHSFCLFARTPGGYRGAYAFPGFSPRDKALWCRSVWQHIAPAYLPGHPCPMPLVMALGVIQGWSLPPDTICDPFMGSGTTGVVAVQLGRPFIGIERDRDYFTLACRRIEQATRQLDLFHAPAPAPTQPRLFPSTQGVPS